MIYDLEVSEKFLVQFSKFGSLHVHQHPASQAPHRSH